MLNRFLESVVVFTLLFSAKTIQSQSIINALALGNGSRFIRTPLSYTPNSERANFQAFSPDALLDLSSKMWCSEKNASFPFVFEIELSEGFALNQLVFDTRVENYAGISAKNVKVAFSLDKSEYVDEEEFVLAENKLNTFEVPNLQARRIRLTILSNYGHANYTELSEFKAFGTPRHELATEINIDGTWETNWQLINFKQNRKEFTATYSYDKTNATTSGRVKNGKIDHNRLEFEWEEEKLKGRAVLYMNEEGDRLSGKWWNDNRADDFGLWIMSRNKPVPIQNKIKTEDITFGEAKVELGKKVVMQNVLFQQSKAIMLKGSETELDKLVELLKTNPNLKVEISGHTDNTGDPKLSMELSEERVDVVKSYLVDHDIKKRRIKGKGYGGIQPIADNKKEDTRRLNRRVEFMLY